MDINEAAKILGISTKTLRKYIKNGTIEARLVEGKTGKEWNLSEESVEEFKRGRVEGVAFPGVEKPQKTGLPTLSTPAKVPARVEKHGTEVRIKESPGVQALPISLGPSRASEKAGRYLESLPDVCNIEEAATFLGVSVSTVRDYLRTNKLRGLKLGKGWKISKASLERFVKTLLG